MVSESRKNIWEELFERFYRIDKSRSGKKVGRVLGFSIVKHIIEAHDGQVKVKSTAGEGAEFSFKLKKGKAYNWTSV